MYHTSIDQTGNHHVMNDVECFRCHRMLRCMMLHFVREHGLKTRKRLFHTDIHTSATKGQHKLLSEHLGHGKEGALIHLIAVNAKEENTARIVGGINDSDLKRHGVGDDMAIQRESNQFF